MDFKQIEILVNLVLLKVAGIDNTMCLSKQTILIFHHCAAKNASKLSK